MNSDCHVVNSGASSGLSSIRVGDYHLSDLEIPKPFLILTLAWSKERQNQ